MTEISIYNKDGIEVDIISLEDNIRHVNGRVSKGQKFYYKGVGAPYHGHFLEPNTKTDNRYKIIDIPNIFYVGPYVHKDCFSRKIGIFQEKYQPQFTDFIGSCGAKELSIIENSEEFERSSVQIIKSVNYDKDNQQYYFVMNYKCDRKKYKDIGDPKDLYFLLEYMIKEDWNFIWDKTSIEDISYNGLVSDVGDIFRSKSIDNKLGTVYSVLYSLGNLNPRKYHEFIHQYNLEHNNSMSYVYNSINLLDKFGVDVSQLTNSNPIDNYKNAVMNYLIVGKNCGDCCYIELGDKIRQQYIVQTRKQLGIDA